MDENERCWCASTLNRWYIRSLQPMSPQITPPRMASHQEARHQKFSNIWTCSSTGLNNVPHIACLKCSGEEDQKTNWFTQANITLGCTTYECKINTLLIPNSNNNTPKWQELELKKNVTSTVIQLAACDQCFYLYFLFIYFTTICTLTTLPRYLGGYVAPHPKSDRFKSSRESSHNSLIIRSRT